MQKYSSGATRDSEEGKLDFEAFLSPHVLHRYARYLQKHGSGRAGDNWQLGIPPERYMKSLIRHVIEAWTLHRERDADMQDHPDGLEDALCAVIFNAMGYLYEQMGVRGGTPAQYNIKDATD